MISTNSAALCVALPFFPESSVWGAVRGARLPRTSILDDTPLAAYRGNLDTVLSSWRARDNKLRPPYCPTASVHPASSSY